MEIVRKEFKLNTVGTLSIREILPQSIADLAQSLHDSSTLVHVQIETNRHLTQQAFYSYSILPDTAVPGRTIGNTPCQDGFQEIDVEFGRVIREREEKTTSLIKICRAYAGPEYDINIFSADETETATVIELVKKQHGNRFTRIRTYET